MDRASGTTIALLLAVLVSVAAAPPEAGGVGPPLSGDEPQPPAVREPELRTELLQRMKTDQEARTRLTDWQTRTSNQATRDEATWEASLTPPQRAEWQALGAALQRVDEANTRRMEEVVGRHGWPTASLVGRDGAIAAWLLVQHADHAPRFQRKCLDLMAQAPPDEVRPADLAYLTDRVLLAEGKKQRYGSQIVFNNGKCQPQPIEDEAHVNQRRREVGLEPIEEYLKLVSEFYGGSPPRP